MATTPNLDEKLAKFKSLKELAERVVADITAVEAKINNLTAAGGEPNKIEKVKVNGTEQSISSTDKSVNIAVPTKTSQLANDSGYQTAAQLQSAVNSAINEFATKISDDGVINTFKESIDYIAEHGSEFAAMLGDITALQTSVGNKVEKVSGKGLSTNDYTTAEKQKLANISPNANNYTHPSSAAGAKSSGLYKITTDANGHVTATAAVTKNDITNLGIPGQDTTYDIATDAEVTAMLNEVFGA